MATVDLWVAGSGDLLDTSLRVVNYSGISHFEDWLVEYDYVFYNDAPQRHSGIVILHDLARREALVGAAGVVVHSDALFEKVRYHASSPVTKIHLAHSIDRTCLICSRAELGVPPDRLLLITIGPVNPNRCIEQTLRALAADSHLKRRIHYLVLGSCDSFYGQRMLELSRDLGLQETVRFTGYVDEPALRAALVHADLCCNLRWPDTGAASDSLVLEMLFGRAIIVIDSGVFGELPEGAAAKVRPGREVEDVGRHLRHLVSDEDARHTMGQAALRFASEHCSARTYASQLLAFCRNLAKCEPAFELAELVARELKAIGVTPDMPIVDRIARESAMLLYGDDKKPGA